MISFHPEIAGENRVHELFLRDVACRVIVYFTRHGESVANVADRELQPAPEDADRLSERGWEQARGVGERLRGEGIDAIVASPYGRAQETAHGDRRGARAGRRDRPGHARGAPVRRLPRRLPALRRDRHVTWMPAAAPDHAEPGAESFAAIVGRVGRVQERLAARIDDERILCVSHWGFLHFFLGAAMFGEAFAPAHLPGALPDLARQHRHHDLRAPPRLPDRRRPLRRLGAADLERQGHL